MVGDRPGAVAAWMRANLLYVFICLLAVVGIFFRFFMLHRMPGINGDEAYGLLLVRRFVSGQSFTMMTPNGHYGSWIWVLIHGIFALFLPDNFTTLRIPVAFCATVLMCLNGWLFIRSMGWRQGVAMTLLLLCLPATIGYSRINWNIMLIVPFASCALMMAWQGKIWLTVLVALAALFDYPPNVFIIPLVAPLLIWHIFTHPAWTSRSKWGILAASLLVALIGPMITVWMLPSLFIEVGPMFARLANPAEMALFLQLFLRLISGVTIYGDFSGLPSADIIAALDLLFGVVFIMVVGAGSVLFVKRRRSLELLLLAGFLLALGAFYFTGGYGHLVEGYERHGLPFVAPAIMLFVCALEQIFITLKRPSFLLWFTSVACALWLFAFGWCYFGELFTSGGNCSKIYRTAAKEPKAAAFEWITEDWTARRNAGAISGLSTPHEIVILAEDWWNYWPLKILASGRVDLPFNIVFLKDLLTIDQVRELLVSGAYAQGFTDEFLYNIAHQSVPAGSIVDHTVLDASGRSLIYIWRLAGPAGGGGSAKI